MKKGDGKSLAFGPTIYFSSRSYGGFNINPFVHPTNSFIVETFLPCLSEKPHFLHYPFQPRPAFYQLLDRGQAISRSNGDSGLNEIWRNFLGDAQNCRFGLVQFWSQNSVHSRTQKQRYVRYNNNPLSLGKDLEKILKFHVGSKRHRIPLIRFVEFAQRRAEKDRLTIKVVFFQAA